MYNVWVLDVRAQPPVVVAHASCKEMGALLDTATGLVVAFPLPHYTLVHEVNSTSLGIPEAG